MVEMNTGTIDYAIDLGNEKSIMAKADGNNSMVIPNTIDNQIFLTSAVYIDKRGRLFVGDKAKRKMSKDPLNGFSEFRLRMGSDYTYNFEETGRQLTPVELTAEILKSLKNSVKEINNNDLKAVVITVPTGFDALQNRDTIEAAKLAGFQQVILLQEPIAAAYAYGFDKSDENGFCLIYDYGQTSFKASVLTKNDEELFNIHEDCDSYLGGRLIDWDIVDKILAPAISEELGLADFERRNSKYQIHFAKLKKAAETLKQELLNYETAEVDIEEIRIGDKEYDFEIEMDRMQLNEIMEPYVNRSIKHCMNAVEGAGIGLNDISRIILVGDSCLDPYVQERLSEEFDVPLEYSINPITVVARGAAIYAGTIPCNVTEEDSIQSSGFVGVEVLYDSTGEDSEFDVVGKIISRDGDDNNYYVEFLNTQTQYSSGRIAADIEGVFMTKLYAENDENTYEIRVYDGNGNRISISHDSIKTIHYGIKTSYSKDMLLEKFIKQQERYFELISKSPKGNSEVRNYFNQINDKHLIQNISKSLNDDKDDPKELKNINNQINDLSKMLDIAGSLIEKPEDDKLNLQDNVKNIKNMEHRNISDNFRKNENDADNNISHMGKQPLPAYQGDDDYIYCCYAHRDADRVFPDLISFYNHGFNVWYDEGITAGNEWAMQIERTISNCSLFVVFISANSVASKNVRNELYLANSENIPILPIYLEDTELKYGLKLTLMSFQSILKFALSDEQYVKAYTKAFKQYGLGKN